MTAIEFAQTVTELSAYQQNELLASLKEILTEEEYIATAKFLSLYGIFTNPEKYEAMKAAVCETVSKEFYK